MILLGLMEAAAGPSVAGEALSVARGISEYGILVVVAAFFLVLAGGTMVWHMKSYRKLMDSVVKDFADSIDSVRDIAERNRQTMADIAEALTPETRLRVENLAGVCFDLAIEKVCRIIKRIREENHIANREATAAKIRAQLTNLYEERNTRFDFYTWRGRRLSSFCPREWVERIARVVEGELYNEAGPNNRRAYTNVRTAYEGIRLDFLERIDGKKQD